MWPAPSQDAKTASRASDPLWRFEFTPGYLGTRFLTQRELELDQLAIIAFSDVPVTFTHKLDYSNASNIIIIIIIIIVVLYYYIVFYFIVLVKQRSIQA